VAGILALAAGGSQVLPGDSVGGSAAGRACLSLPLTLLEGTLLASEPAPLQPMVKPPEVPPPAANPPEALPPASKSPVQGRPPSLEQFKQDLRAVIARSRCPTCRGKGTVLKRKGVRYEGDQPVIMLKEEWCPTCKGERLQWKDGTYAFFMQAARDGTAIVLGGGAEAERATARTIFGQLIGTLADVGDRYRSGFLKEMRADLAKEGAGPPRGLCVFGQVRELQEGPDGQYLTIMPPGSPATFAMRAEGLLTIVKPGYSALRSARPSPGDWIIVGGIAEGPVKIGKGQPIFVHPFMWVPGPAVAWSGPPAAGADVGRAEPKSKEPGPTATGASQSPPGTPPSEKQATAGNAPPSSPGTGPADAETSSSAPAPPPSEEQPGADNTPPPSSPAGPKAAEPDTSRPPPESQQPPTKPTGMHKDVEFFGL